MARLRFELFTATSLALHAALFVGFAMRRAPASLAAGASAGQPGQGSAAVAGETFEVPDLEQMPDETTASPEAPPIELDGPAAPTPEANGDAPAPKPSKKTRGVQAQAHASAPSAASEPPPPPALYGAVGDRTAGDLVTSFKRMFPVGASYDPLWEKVPVGFYAEGDVTFHLAGDGTITHVTVSAAAAPAFKVAIQQTTTLLKHRLFTARGEATHVHMVVRVTGNVVNHGAFTIDSAGSFELRSGKHVSVSIVER
jgi:hypothetical protein